MSCWIPKRSLRDKSTGGAQSREADPTLDSSSRPSNSLLELTSISAYTRSYEKATSSLTPPHLITLTLDIPVSFNASHDTDSMRDLIKNLQKKLTTVLQSCAFSRDLSNYTNKVRRWLKLMEEPLQNPSWTAGTGQAVALFPKTELLYRFFSIPNGKYIGEQRAAHYRVQGGASPPGDAFYYLSQSPFICILYRNWLVFN